MLQKNSIRNREAGGIGAGGGNQEPDGRGQMTDEGKEQKAKGMEHGENGGAWGREGKKEKERGKLGSPTKESRTVSFLFFLI